MSPRSVAFLVLWPLLLAPVAAAAPPGDARAGEQWAVAPKAVFNLPAAWEASRGAGVTVAVIDTGARIEHPDLAPNVWVNFGETPRNRVDDDGNGYVDDVHGVDLTSTAKRQDLTDGYGHGTHVAGTIAAAANRRGVVGVAPRARLMIVKVIPAKGAGRTSAVAEGIRYAVANGAQVINMSLSGSTKDDRVRDAILAAADANVVVVCSAGNDGLNIDRKPAYPVAYAAANLIGVAATAPDTGKALGDFSNFGRRTVAVAAPGADVLSTTSDGGYGFMSGTSMAAPHVAGVVALMRSVAPKLSAAEIRAVLLQNAARSSLPIGSGYVDARGAVRGAAAETAVTLGQRPRLRVVRAQSAGKGRGATTVIQFGVSGATDAVRRYRVLLGRKRVAELAPGPSVLTARVRRGGKRATVQALGDGDRVISRVRARVTRVPKGKLDIGSGGDVGVG